MPCDQQLGAKKAQTLSGKIASDTKDPIEVACFPKAPKTLGPKPSSFKNKAWSPGPGGSHLTHDSFMEMPGNQGYLLGLGAGIYFGLVLGFDVGLRV